MLQNPTEIVSLSASSANAGAAMADLLAGKIGVLRVIGLCNESACSRLAHHFGLEHASEVHMDVDGLRVVGLSHFQVARDPSLRVRYLHEGARAKADLQRLLGSDGSPFDAVIAYLSRAWPYGCQGMRLPSEGLLSPFAIRIYRDGAEIEPHQDILAAESPMDPAAKLGLQLAGNIYLSVGSKGGELELFEADPHDLKYNDLSEGPKVISRDRLRREASISPGVGELILFSSERVHAVTPSWGKEPRITLSFFVGVRSSDEPLYYWI